MSEKLNRIFALFVVTAIFAAMLPMTPRPASAEAPALPAQEHRSEQAVNRDTSVPAIPTQPQQPTIVEREDGARYVSGELIVRFSPDVGRRVAIQSLAPGRLDATGVQSLDKLGMARGLQAIEPIFRRHTRDQAIAAWRDLPPMPSLGDVYKLTFPAGVDVEQLVADYSTDPNVVYAEPNYVYEFDGTPDDPYFGQQWHLHNTGQYHLADADIDAPEAWDVITGTETIVIAVIDTGVDRDHPDLDGHVWANPGETPGDGVDNDGNGYTDDTWGWNWVSDASDPDDYDFDDPRDDNGHGTHVAGIVAAETDNTTGVAGVCWNCRIMSLKAFESNGVGTTSDIVQAIDYAADKGADVINMSFGSYAESLLLEDTLADAYGQAVLVAAAGNYGKTRWATTPYYPASYSYVLGVGATDVGCVQRDPITLACLLVDEHRADFSNYGVNADVGAPGVSIYSTFRGGDYASLSGTSMAAPIVSGLAALLLSQNPTWSKEMARGQIIKTTDAIYTQPGTRFTAVGSGRVNAYSALTVVPTPDVTLLDDSILYGDSTGDGDGIPDAGETFTITMLLKNYWGEALTTTAVLSTTDPYVTIISDTATFGDISAYAMMRNTATPFQAVLTTTAPNNHQVSFDLDITANGGAYNTTAGFSFLVQRGIEIPDPLFPAVITESMTLHSDYLYIVKQNMLVSQGVTLTIEPGTRLQFDPDKFIKIEGTLIASGTADLPIYFTSNQKDPQPGDFKGIVFGDSATDARLDGTPIITSVVASGDPTPLGGEFITFTTPAVMNPVGDIVFGATISDSTTSAGLFRWLRGHVQPIIAAGETAPGTGGATFAGFREAQIDNAGDVAFLAGLSDGGQGVFSGNELGVEKVAATGDVVLDGTTPLTLTTFNYVTADEVGNVAFRATYWLTDSLVTKPGIFVYRVEQDKVYPIVGDLGYPFDRIVDVGSPLIQSSGDEAATRLYFAVEGTSTRGIPIMQYLDSLDHYATQNYVYDGKTLADGSVMTFTVQDRVIPETNGVWFSTHLDSIGWAIVDCSGGIGWSSCNSVGAVMVGDGDPAPGGRTLQFTGTIPYVSTGLEIVYNANLSGTAEIHYGIVMSDTDSLVSLVEEGDALPGGRTVAAIANVSILPYASKLGAVAAIVDVAGGAPGEQRLLLIDRDDAYASGSILNHVVLEYGGGLLINDSFPYIANSVFRQSGGTIPAGQSSVHGVIVVDRQEDNDGNVLLMRGNQITNNTSRGMFVFGEGAGRLIFSGNTVLNNTPSEGNYNSPVGAGLFFEGAEMVANLEGNIIEFNTSESCAGINVLYYHPLGQFIFQGNNLSRNNARVLSGSGGGGGCLDSASGVFRYNIIAGNLESNGYQPGDSVSSRGGSALRFRTTNSVIQYNTIIGNEAKPGPSLRPAPGHTMFFCLQTDSPPQVTHNNILGNYSSYDLYLSNHNDQRGEVNATNNFWGTTDVNEIRYDRIYDYWQDFEPGEAVFQPFLTAPEPLAPGFLLNATTYPPDPIGAEIMTATLDFSKEMNTTIMPTVRFGVDEPYTQNTIENGSWISSTRWVGSYEVSVDTGDGINILKVSGAEDMNEMEIPEDTRFSFVIQTAGTASILLEATASVGQVDLTWVQNDVTDLAGYILYRSPYTNTGYAQIGDGMFVATTYTDTDVTNGVLYYYQYSVLDTDFNEVAWSNEVSVTPDDYTLPATPSVTDDGASTYYFDRLHATWASQDPETGVAEYQYCIGTAVGACDTVSWTAMGTLTETTKSGLNLTDGQTYYFNVKARNGADHWSTTGSSDGITVDKLAPPVITAVEPITGVRNTSHVITFTGSGFQASPAPAVRLDGSALGSVNVVSPTQLTALVPQGIAAGVYTATVTNFDTQVGTLANGYTAANPAVGPRPFLFSPSTQRVGDDETSTTVDVQIQDVSDLAAFQFDVTYNPAVAHVSDVTLGWFLGSGGRNTADLGPDIDNTAGRVTFGGFSYGTGSGAEGNGTLATITFSPQATGTTALTFENVQLRDTLNSEIPADLQSGEIEVVHYPFGDLDRDCDVDVADIMVVASRWNTVKGDPDYDPAYDFDGDDDIDVADIMQVAAAWGNTCNGTMMCTAGGFDETGPTLRLAPLQSHLEPGERVDLAVEIQGADNLGGVQFDLLFDPAQFDLESVTLGPALGSTGNTAQSLAPLVDPETGRVTCGGFSFGEHDGPDAGRLMVVSLVARREGAATVGLGGVQLVDLEGQVHYPAGVEPARLTIGQVQLYLPLILK